MPQIAQAPSSCHFGLLPGIRSEQDFCAFEFPWCAGCPKSMAEKSPVLEDPIKSPIWRGWINAIASVKDWGGSVYQPGGQDGEFRTQAEYVAV